MTRIRETGMRDYQEAYASFSLDDFAQEVLRAPLDGELNPYELCCARWADGDLVALRWMGADGRTRDVTYRELDVLPRSSQTGMPSLSQVLVRPRNASWLSRPSSLRVPALTLRRVT